MLPVASFVSAPLFILGPLLTSLPPPLHHLIGLLFDPCHLPFPGLSPTNWWYRCWLIPISYTCSEYGKEYLCTYISLLLDMCCRSTKMTLQTCPTTMEVCRLRCIASSLLLWLPQEPSTSCSLTYAPTLPNSCIHFTMFCGLCRWSCCALCYRNVLTLWHGCLFAHVLPGNKVLHRIFEAQECLQHRGIKFSQRGTKAWPAECNK